MGWAGELADFKAVSGATQKALGKSRSKRPGDVDAPDTSAATAASTSHDTSTDTGVMGAPEVSDLTNKGYEYREGGIVKPVPWKWSKARR
jgi:hypothetical protein